MSQLVSTLVAEHVHIQRVLTALHDFAAFHAHDDADVRGAIGQFVTYLRKFVDGWHHHKEEDLLFDALERGPLPRDTGPLACMYADHDAGRQHVGMLAELAAASGPLDEEELAILRRTVMGYVRLLSGHIVKEDDVLYPMAERLLPGRDLDALDEAAAAVDDANAAEGQRLRALGDELIARYAAARVGRDPAPEVSTRTPSPR